MDALQTIIKPGEVISKHITAKFGTKFPGDVILFYHGQPITHYDNNALSLLMGRIEDLDPNYHLGRFYSLANIHLDFTEDALHYWRHADVNRRIHALCNKNGWFKN